MTEALLGRNALCHCGSGKKYKKCHLDADQHFAAIERNPNYPDALHESGHVIVAHALGRQVELVRVGKVPLPVGHPHNPFDTPQVSLGFHRSRPLLAEEVNTQHEAELPFTDEQMDWLLTEAIISWGGAVAEMAIETPIEITKQAARADLEGFASVAEMLGQIEEREGQKIVNPPFQSACAETAKTIILELLDNHLKLTDTLTMNPGEWSEETVQSVLEQLGSPRGSHRHLLDDLQERFLDLARSRSNGATPELEKALRAGMFSPRCAHHHHRLT